MKTFKKLITTLLILCMIIAFSSCAREFANYRPIEDVNNLDGRKVGVQIAWAADYILSPRDGNDLILYRYDTTADMLTALFYHQIDAVCLDSIEIKTLEKTNGNAINVVEDPVSADGYLCYAAPTREDLCDDFNEFIKAYHETDEFKDLYERLMDFDGIHYVPSSNIHKNGNGEKIRMAFCADYFPYCYTETDGTIAGYDIEIMYAFADYFNYELELIETSYEDMFYSVTSSRYDMGIGTISIAYSSEARAVGLFPTDTYYDIELFLVELKEGEKFTMNDTMYVTY